MRTIRTIAACTMAAALMMILIPVNAQQGQDKDQMEQKRKEMSEKFRARKIAFITEQLSLTPGEAEKFWPVYNEMEQKREAITQNLMERFRDPGRELAEPTEEEAEKIMQQRFDEEQQLLDLKKEYHKKFTGILPSTKVLRLYEAENMFRRHLMESIGHRHDDRRPEEGARGKPRMERYPMR